MAYVRKTCPCCKGPAHESVMEDAQCTFDYYEKKGFNRDQSLACVTLSFGQAFAQRIQRSIPSK